jgi:hypothetical protein
VGCRAAALERQRGVPTLTVINVDTIARASRLIGVYGANPLPVDFHFSDSLDAFNTYFVNPYADHYMHEFLTWFTSSFFLRYYIANYSDVQFSVSASFVLSIY